MRTMMRTMTTMMMRTRMRMSKSNYLAGWTFSYIVIVPLSDICTVRVCHIPYFWFYLEGMSLYADCLSDVWIDADVHLAISHFEPSCALPRVTFKLLQSQSRDHPSSWILTTMFVRRASDVWGTRSPPWLQAMFLPGSNINLHQTHQDDRYHDDTEYFLSRCQFARPNRISLMELTFPDAIPSHDHCNFLGPDLIFSTDNRRKSLFMLYILQVDTGLQILVSFQLWDLSITAVATSSFSSVFQSLELSFTTTSSPPDLWQNQPCELVPGMVDRTEVRMLFWATQWRYNDLCFPLTRRTSRA